MEISCVGDATVVSNLVRRAASGDMDACNELITQYRVMAVRTANSFVRDKDIAEDIAQEAFVRTLASLQNLRSPDAFKSYLTRTIVRLSINHSKKSSSSEIVLSLDSPEADQMSAEDAIYIHDILDRLSPKLRIVIVLKDISGLDYAAIAKTLRLPIGTVRSRLSAARASFKRLYLGGLSDEQEGRS